LFNHLDADYRPLRDPSLPALRPRFPSRVQRFVYACGKAAAIVEGRMKDTRGHGTPPARRPSRVQLPPGVRDPRKN
jgi:hypothetical protein